MFASKTIFVFVSVKVILVMVVYNVRSLSHPNMVMNPVYTDGLMFLVSDGCDMDVDQNIAPYYYFVQIYKESDKHLATSMKRCISTYIVIDELSLISHTSAPLM